MPLRDVELRGKTVLVTGGTGGIGARVVEKLVVEHGAHVRVLIRSLNKAPRIARFSVDLVQGDVTDINAVRSAVQDCPVVIHCAYGTDGSDEIRRQVNVEGTRNVMQACLDAGTARVVHISTCRVYGVITPDSDLDETAPWRYSKNIYTDTKLDAEKIVVEYIREKSLPASIIQPTTVYGPFVPVWTTNVMERMKRGRTILVNGGTGVCNAVYVDDVADAILLAAVKDTAIGEAFLISGPQPVTWRDFYERYNDMIGGLGTVSMSADEARAHYNHEARKHRPRSLYQTLKTAVSQNEELLQQVIASREVQASVKLAKLFFSKPARTRIKTVLFGSKRMSSDMRGGSTSMQSSGKPINALHHQEISYFAAKTVFRIDKARKLLGYEPAFDFRRGTAVTEKWARWANLCPGP